MLLPKRIALIAFVAMPIFIAALSWFVSERLTALDVDVFERILIASRTPFDAAAVPAWSAILNLFILIGASAAGFHSGVKLSSVPRIIVWVQLFVGFIVLQSVLAVAFNIVGHPLGYTAGLSLGMMGGYAVRQLLIREDAYESRYYELLIRNRELQETRLQLVKHDEVERRNLAADLHDQVLNDLKALKQKLALYTAQPSAEMAKELDVLVSSAINQVRDVMDNLCPSILEHIGLAAALEDCLRRGAERGGYKVKFKNTTSAQDLEKLSTVEQSLLFRLVQETVTNICKHAGAGSVRGSVEVLNDRLVINIADDGRGFDFALLNSESRGFRFMRQRADLIGATIAWRRGADDKGIVVVIELSLADRNDTHSNN